MQKKEEIEIQFDDISINFMNSDGQSKNEACRKVLIQFCKKLADIQKTAFDNFIDPAELLIMISRNYGWIWETIPWGRLDEVKIWCKNNWWRHCQMLNPEQHNILMQTENDYSTWFKNISKGIETREIYS